MPSPDKFDIRYVPLMPFFTSFITRRYPPGRWYIYMDDLCHGWHARVGEGWGGAVGRERWVVEIGGGLGIGVSLAHEPSRADQNHYCVSYS